MPVIESMFLSANYNIDIWGEYKCKSDWRIKERTFYDYDFFFVVSGKGLISVNEVDYAICAPELYILKPGDLVNALHDPGNPLHVYTMHFFITDREGYDILRYFDIPERVPLEDSIIFESFFKEALRHQNEKCYSLKKLAAFLQILLYLLEKRFVREIRIKEKLEGLKIRNWHTRQFFRIYDYIESNLSHCVSLTNLSDQFHLSKNSLIRLFQKETYLSPQKYISKLKMEHALQLLKSGQSVKKTALSLGFSDLCYFSKKFKQFHRLPPSAIINLEKQRLQPIVHRA